MEEKDNLHAGHRERIYKKLSENPDSLLDHELLETLLFYSIPRVDTNPLAHRLIRSFGSLEKVLSASKADLMTVDGVGDKTANLILVTGRMYKSIEKNKTKKIALKNLADVMKVATQDFEGEKTEKIVLYLLDEKRVVTAKLEFSDRKEFEVVTDVSETSKALAVHKPKFLIVAHNHTSGNEMPSAADDVATKKINLLCDIHGVELTDHVIYANGKFFSYRSAGRLDYVKHNSNINKLLDGIQEEE
jgi:DNA repair protein RadC